MVLLAELGGCWHVASRQMESATGCAVEFKDKGKNRKFIPIFWLYAALLRICCDVASTASLIAMCRAIRRPWAHRLLARADFWFDSDSWAVEFDCGRPLLSLRQCRKQVEGQFGNNSPLEKPVDRCVLKVRAVRSTATYRRMVMRSRVSRVVRSRHTKILTGCRVAFQAINAGQRRLFFCL